MAKWTTEDIQTLRDNWIYPLDWNSLCTLLNRKREAIYIRAFQIGLTKDKNANNETIKSESLNKGIRFLEEYEKTGNVLEALKISNLTERLLRRLRERDSEFKEKYIAIKNKFKTERHKRNLNRYYENNKEECLHKRNKAKLTLNGRFNCILSRIRSINPLTDIDKEYLFEIYNKQEGKCYYTSDILEFDCYQRHPNLLSIDRIDSNKTYTRDNIVLCCYKANIAKNNMSIA